MSKYANLKIRLNLAQFREAASVLDLEVGIETRDRGV